MWITINIFCSIIYCLRKYKMEGVWFQGVHLYSTVPSVFLFFSRFFRKNSPVQMNTKDTLEISGGFKVIPALLTHFQKPSKHQDPHDTVC